MSRKTYQLMRTAVRSLVAVAAVQLGSIGVQASSEAEQIEKIYQQVLAHSPAYEELRVLTTQYPGRLAGSKNLEAAIRWAEAKLREIGCDSVTLQPVRVPHWERGAPERVELLAGSERIQLTGLALGWSVATPADGLEGPVIEVQSLDELEKLGPQQVSGKIVFFNRPMPPTQVNPSVAYRLTGDQRNRGPAAAAKLGAVGALVRSLTHRLDDEPHTGHTSFAPDAPKIPAVALSTIAADRLSQHLKSNGGAQVRIQVNATWKGEADSFNVIGEIRGTENPETIILVGGHLDSWDVAQGAHDDGTGVVQSIDVLRTFKALGLKPKHTLRCVLFTAEENSLAGAREYARVAKEKGERHLLAIETDGGGFEPKGFELGHTQFAAHEKAARWRPLLEPYGLFLFRKGTGGADVGPLMMQGAVVGDLVPASQRYLDYHHTRIDTFDKVNARELLLGTAALTALIWLVDTQGF
jgi:carboxypeptidase Q